MKRKMFCIFLALVIALTCIACSSKTGSETTTEPKTGSETTTTNVNSNPAPTQPATNEAGEKVMRVALISTPETLGMLRSDGYGTTITQNMSDALVRVNENLELQPGLATDWEWVDENTWRFAIRKDVTFVNGNKLDAECVAYNLNSLTDRELSYRYSSHWGKAWPIKAEAADEYTVFITTSSPSAFVPNLLTRIVIYDDDQWIAEGDDVYFTHPAGTGPYEVESWDIGISITLKKATTPYWDGSEAYFDKIVIDGVSSDAARVAGLQSGEYDMVDAIPYDQVNRLNKEGEGAYSVVASDSVALNWMYFNGYNTSSWTANRTFREAVAHAIDAQAISEVLFGGVCEPKNYVAPSSTFGGDEGYSEAYVYDVELSKKLLQECGYDGSEVVFLMNEGEFSNDIATAEYITAALNAVGINCKLEQMDGSLKDDTRKGGTGDFDMINTPGSFGGISDYYYSQMKSKRGYNNWPELDEVDKLFSEAIAYGLTDAEREAKLREANIALWKQVPVAFSVESNLAIGTKAGLQGVYCLPNSWEIFKAAHY